MIRSEIRSSAELKSLFAVVSARFTPTRYRAPDPLVKIDYVCVVVLDIGASKSDNLRGQSGQHFGASRLSYVVGHALTVDGALIAPCAEVYAASVLNGHRKEQLMALVFITGSTDGLGRAAAQSLIGDGHQVVLHARSADRAATLADLASRSAGTVVGDLSSAAEVRSIADQVNAFGRMDASSTTPASMRSKAVDRHRRAMPPLSR